MTIMEKLPPQDKDAEEAVLGSLLVDGEAFNEIAPEISGDDFFFDKNRWTYESCVEINRRNEGINEVTVAQELGRRNLLEPVGGSAFLSHLVSITPTPFHIKYYAQIVNRTAINRRLIEAGGKIAQIGYLNAADVDKSVTEAEDVLFKIRKDRPQDFVPIRNVLTKTLDHALSAAGEKADTSAPVTTGYPALDRSLGGLQRSDLIILAARTSVGKTSLALNIARNAAVLARATVAIFSLEMSAESIGQRMLSTDASVEYQRLRTGGLPEEEQERVMESSGVLADAPIYIDDTPQIRVMDMRAKARRLGFERGIDLVVLDYLQLMRSDRNTENRVLEIGEITRSLKALARELNCPVLALSQLSRQVEWRASRMPQLSDLRESGNIEQDADQVLFIDRAELHTKRDEWEKFHQLDGQPYPEGQADVIIAKNRNGPLGQIRLRFVADYTRFESYQVEAAAEAS
jgi:replicative DNA helicase